MFKMIENANLFSESYNIIKKYINTNVADPKRRSKKRWVHNSMPDVTSKNFDGYPFFVVQENISENNRSFKNKIYRNMSEKNFRVLITIYSEDSSQIDTLSDELFSKMKSKTITDNLADFRSIQLVSSPFNSTIINGRKIYNRALTIRGLKRTGSGPMAVGSSDSLSLIEGNVGFEANKINSWTDLYNIRNKPGSDFELERDLSNADDDYAGIGDDWEPIPLFSGTFDGKGHTISDLIIFKPELEMVGLFQEITGPISNLKLLNVYCTGYVYVGGLVGFQSGELYNCSVSGTISGEMEVGGLVGISLASIDNCYSTGSVTGTEIAGGLVAELYGVMKNSYSLSNVYSSYYVGGLVGWCINNIENSYSAGGVSGTSYFGGLIGERYYGNEVISNCFWDIETSGQATSDGGTGKTTAEMKAQTTFTNWDFDTIWQINEGVSYPTLR